MISQNQILEEIQQTLNGSFRLIKSAIIAENSIKVEVTPNDVAGILLYLRDHMGFIHLSHISCVDWIEDKQFELVYIIWSPEKKLQINVTSRIDRDKPTMENIDHLWRQANTYEREFREMFGIEFPGLIAKKEFILEDWDDIPPMRKEFDTLEYVNDSFWEREGREDAKDVRETIAERSGEDIPGFAKKYSRDND